ncbi:flagellar filament capping protein FliD [Vibrio sp.]|nr:flagellar filament capping protein FliD [Vibrio sp.]
MNIGAVGGGMDINSVVRKVVDSERIPKQARIDIERSDNQASISAYGRLRESLDSMKTYMSTLRLEDAFSSRKVNTSDENTVTANATPDAIAGRYSVDVLQLAQHHKVASGVLDKKAEFGPGEINIGLGKHDFTVEVDKNTRLVDLIKSINSDKNNPGVRASIINDVEGPRIIIASDHSGKDKQLSIAVDSDTNNPLKKMEYLTFESRVRDLEKARSAAQELIAPLTPVQKNLATKVADSIADSAKSIDIEISIQGGIAGVGGLVGEGIGGPSLHGQSQSGQGTATNSAGAKGDDGRYKKPEESIPGWSETASGTLLDSYEEPQAELDKIALDKMGDVPGWSNTASGTLTELYLTPKEAKIALEQKQVEERNKIQQQLKNGEITPEQASEQYRENMTDDKRQFLNKLEGVLEKLVDAQANFDHYSGMKEIESGQNSRVILDGVAELSSANNVIEDAIKGVDLQLQRMTPEGEAPAEIDITYDRVRVKQDIEGFVQNFNQFYKLADEIGGVDVLSGEAGPLAGDSLVRSTLTRLKGVIGSRIDQAPEGLQRLTEFGVTTTREGTLEINYQILNRQINENFTNLSDFFGGKEGFAKRIEDAIHEMTGFTGSIRSREKTLTDQNYRLDDRQVDLDRRIEALEQRTHNKFASMQDATSKMQGQLARMMNALGG